ncbi:glycerophosphoryl diester phosphodiesterase [Noviherbaspirillum humi]|uniref:Glycerophosphoryl diester phosphodiesterase n=1 Tax=Noviherbaspirillum humi TaxID=1688639 RepID=A0A239KFX9_9BURK|nr:glycerophosphodiester phosphodiesterase [Noviherbaspirillum humi]SNT16612.1 glycerophosphoryl diester phosphodiesterase [Noviherbaspirillum humi]
MWPYPSIIAHRGGGTLAPENTLAALRCGLAHGFRAVEFDVMLAADGVPVLMHDPVFGRTIRQEGSVSASTAAELAAMDAGAWFGPAFEGEPVPRYEEAVRFCRLHGIWMNVEIKPAPGAEAETGRMVGQLTRQWFGDLLAAGAAAAQLPLFSSFSEIAMEAALQAAPDIPRGLLVERVPEDWLQRLQRLQAAALHVNHRYLTPDQTAAVKQSGHGLFCYTVNDPARGRELLSWGVDAFCTDRIDVIGAEFR